MCYSAEASMFGWVVSVTIAMYLLYRNKRYDLWNAGFILTFSAVQLWEAGIWSTNDPTTQELYVKLIALTLIAQPFAQSFGAWHATGKKSRFLEFLMALYGLLFMYVLSRTSVDKFWVSKGPNEHLVWHTDGNSLAIPGYTIGWLYIFGMFAGLFYGLPTTIPLLAVGVATSVWSLTRVNTDEFASYWCYIAMAYSITALFI